VVEVEWRDLRLQPDAPPRWEAHQAGRGQAGRGQAEVPRSDQRLVPVEQRGQVLARVELERDPLPVSSIVSWISPARAQEP